MSGFTGVRADHGGRCFDAVPGLVQRLMAEPGEPRIVLVWIDAFGWRFAERHADHPWLRRVAESGTIERWTSQFPSTTTAHYVTLHSTLPVAEHGMYEWFVYEPSLDRMICPLKYSFAGDHDRGTLAGVLDSPAGLFPPVTPLLAGMAQQGIDCHAFQSSDYTPGVATDLALMGAAVHPFADPAGGLEELAAVMGPPGRRFAFVYLDTVDATGHVHGPDSPQFDAALTELLDGLERLSRSALDARLVVTADHGMTAVDPATAIYVNREWPGISDHLRRGADGGVLAPGGSARDLFLHVEPDSLDLVIGRLEAMVGDRADVHATAQLLDDGVFGPAPSQRLRSRIGDVLVLPRAGETVWWFEQGRYEQSFRGHHGGASADEMEIPLITVPIG